MRVLQGACPFGTERGGNRRGDRKVLCQDFLPQRHQYRIASVYMLRSGQNKDGDPIEIDMALGVIHNLSSDDYYKTTPLPEFLREIVDAGGLVEYTRRQVARVKA